MLLRGLRDRLSAYSGIITPITGTLIPDIRGGEQIDGTAFAPITMKTSETETMTEQR